MEEMMEFKITEAEARDMAKLEKAVGCNLSAGADYGIYLDRIMELGLNQTVDLSKFIDLINPIASKED